MQDMNALFGMFDHGIVEALPMRWLKRDVWKIGIIITSTLWFLVLMTWNLGSEVRAYTVASRLATPGTVTIQVTPTVDATVTALNKEKLAQEVQQLKNQNEPDFFGWLRTNASLLLSTLVVVIGGLIGLLRYLAERRDSQKRFLEDRQAEREKQEEQQKRWLKDQDAEREKRAEERFQAVVVGLGSKDIEARTGAAIMLRTFLQPGYEQFYQQSFDLAVAHLRLRHVDPKIPEPLDSLSQALITVFKESFAHARRILEEQSAQLGPQSLDASHIQLDHAFLIQSDLEQVWMREAFLREARLYDAKLRGAYLRKADLCEGYLDGADLTEANLTATNLSKTHLSRAKFRGADLHSADLREADLSKTNIEDALSLKNANLRGVKGLTKEQLAACKAKGAIIDEDSTTVSFQSIVSPPSPGPRNDTQASYAPSVQEILPTSDAGGSATPSTNI